MLSESTEHVPAQSGQPSSSLSTLSYESESTADPDCPSPQLSLSSPASPANLSDSAVMGAAQEPSSGPLRSRSGSRSHDAANDPKGKRKRSRVTPEQLAHLERFFAADRSPTAARRKEISDMLGMTERQTQIWFQNRRAKAKLLDGKLDQESMELPPDVPPELAAGWDTDLQLLVHEDDEPITIVPCQELTVGSWRRLASAVTKYDLVAYICHNRKTLAWFIHASGCGFKMEIPFDSVIDTKFTNSTPGLGQASFILSRPPSFYMEHASGEPGPGGIPVRVWRPSSDWTERKQASKVLRHDLIGAAIQLAHVLRTIASARAGPSIPLYPITYDSSHPAGRQASGLALSPSLVARTPGGMMSEIAGPSRPQQSTARRFSRASPLHYHDSSMELAVGPAPSNALAGSYHSLARGPGSPPLSSPPYPMTAAEFATISSSSGTYADHSTTPSPMPSSPEHFLHVQVPISMSRRSFSGTPSLLGPQTQGDFAGNGEEMRIPPSISHSGRRHSTFVEGSVGPLAHAVSSLGSHPPRAWETMRSNISIPPTPPYLLLREYGSVSTTSSPQLNFATPPEYPPDYQRSFPQG